MGISISGGVKVPQGNFSVTVPTPGFQFWRLETQGSGSATTGNSISELKMTFDSSSNLLDSFTLTSIGGAFVFPLSNINDTIAETDNAVSIGFVPVANGDMDFYVDFGNGNDKSVSIYSIAPQGRVDDEAFNTPTAFNAYSSDNASDWTLVKSFSGITTGIGPWNPGTFRDFDLTT